MSYIEKSFIPPAPTLPPLTPRNISQNKTIKSEDCPSENEEINFALKVILSKSENLFKIYLMSNIKLQPQFQVGPK